MKTRVLVRAMEIEGVDLIGQPQAELRKLERRIGPLCVILPCGQVLKGERLEFHFCGKQFPRCSRRGRWRRLPGLDLILSVHTHSLNGDLILRLGV